MSIEERISKLEMQLSTLQSAFIQAQKNGVMSTSKLDSTSSNLASTEGVVDKNTADIDYIAMMTDVEIPEV